MPSTRRGQTQKAPVTANKKKAPQPKRGSTSSSRKTKSARARARDEDDDDDAEEALLRELNDADDDDDDYDDLVDPPNPTGTQKDKGRQDAPFVSFFPGLDFDNFAEKVDEWTFIGLKKAIADARIPARSRLPPALQEALKRAHRNFEKMLLMCSLIGNCRESLIRRFLKLLPPMKAPTGYSRFLAFSKAALGEPLPAAGDKAAWKRRNIKIGGLWSALSDDERAVFKDPQFFALAGLPNPLDCLFTEEADPEDLDHDEDEDPNDRSDPRKLAVLAPQVYKLHPAREAKFRPLFDKHVDVARVEINYGAAGNMESSKKVMKKSLAKVRAAHLSLARASQQYNVAYYLIATSTEPYDDGWSHVWSNDQAFATYVEKEHRLAESFKFYARGQRIQQAVDDANTSTVHRPPSAIVKLELGQKLNDLLASCLGKTKASFPKGPDPDALLIEYGIRAKVDRDGGDLKDKDYMKGVRGCGKAEKDQWLADIAGNKFSIIALPPDAPVGKRKRKRCHREIDEEEPSDEPRASTSGAIGPLEGGDDGDNVGNAAETEAAEVTTVPAPATTNAEGT